MKDNYRFYEVNGEEYKIGDWESSEFEKDFPTAKVNMSVNGENYLIDINERDEFMKDFAGSEVSYTNFGPTRKEERQARREERQNDGKTTLGETLGKSAASAVVRTGKLALDLARAAWNTTAIGGAVNFVTGKKFDEKLQDENNRITQWSTKLGETADRLSREADPTGGEKGYVDLIKEGNIGQLAQKALASGIESLPMMIAAGSGWGTLLYGAGMAAGEYSDETRENPDIPSWKRAINSMGSAAIEMAVEKIGGPLNDIGKAGKEITEEMAKEILETAVKEGSENIAKRIVKKLGTMVKQGAEEGVEEVITSFGNDALGTGLDLIDGDADYGIQAQWNQLKEQNPDASLADFAKEKGKEYMDAFIGGAVSGLEISTTTEGIGSGVNALRNKESRGVMENARAIGESMTYDDLYDTDSDVANANVAVFNSFTDKDGNHTLSNEFIESLSAEDAYALAGREDFSYQQRKAFGELAVAKAKSDALNGKLDNLREETLAAVRSRMEKATENGQLVTGMVNGKTVYVKGGKVNNGVVTVGENGENGPVIVIDSVTGEETTVNSSEIKGASSNNAAETISGFEALVRNDEAQRRQTARTTMSRRAKIAAVNEFIGKKTMINSENGIIEVEVTSAPQSGKILIKGKKGDLGGQAIKEMDADVFYDSIYRQENGEPVFIEKGEEDVEDEVEVPEVPTAPEAPVVAGITEEDDFRDFAGTIFVDGAPINVSVISQDGPSDTIVYEYEDENGNTRRASTSIEAFKTAVQQGAEYTPEEPIVPETPVAEVPVAEEVSPTEETPTEEEAPVGEVELEPESIDWDALFESDPEAYFVELQNQFGDGAIDMLTAVVEATQQELDSLNKNKGKTQNEIFANVTKKKELQNKIDILNGMIERLSVTPAPEVAPEPVAEPMPEPAPETTPVTETPAPAPAEEPAPTADDGGDTGPIDPNAKETVLDNGYIIKDGYIINPTPIEIPNSPKDFSRIFIAEKDGKWGYQTYVKFDDMTSYGSPKGSIQVSASHLWFDTKEEALKAALHYFDFLKNEHGEYNGKPHGTTGIDAFIQYVKDTYLKGSEPSAPEAVVPVAPNPVDDPINEAKKREKSLATQLKRIGIPHEQKQDMAFNAGKAVADFFATREEYDDYAENATDFGDYNADFERGVEASFANRQQNTGETPGNSVPLENEPKGEENGEATTGESGTGQSDSGSVRQTSDEGGQEVYQRTSEAEPPQGKNKGGSKTKQVANKYPARKGNATQKILKDTFGFESVAIPNSRKDTLNAIYDFMMEMSKMLGISPKSIGQGGMLGVGRLNAKARATAEHSLHRNKFTFDFIDATIKFKYAKLEGIAHEWWHALDYALGYFDSGKVFGTTTEVSEKRFAGRKETYDAVQAVIQAIKDSGYPARIRSLTNSWAALQYYLDPTEMAARAFDGYLRDRFAAAGISIEGASYDYIDKDPSQQTAEEMAVITPALDNLFKVLKEKEGKTPGTSILYHIGEMMDEQSDAKKLATDAVLTALDDTGIEVVRASDEQTQQMIDASGENTEFMISPDNPVFVSNAAMAVSGIKMEKATPEQWLKMIEKAGGLKVGEDKWIGLSDWLKTSDKKTLTKKEVLDYIHENEIKIEEVNYAEIDYFAEDKKFIDALNAEFLVLRKEAEDAGEWIHDAGDIAYQQMVDKYGDDFSIAFGVDRGELYVSNREAASAVTGVDLGTERAIDETRLGYTTEGLSNNKEIALVVPTIESWNESDEIHFGDAGDGRAVAWVRFGETKVTVQDETQQRLNEIYDRLDELEMKVSSTGITEDEYNERARLRIERDELQEIEPKTQRVLVIDEIQSKRHQEGRESGYKVSREKADAEMDKFMKQMHDKYEFTSSTPFAEVFNEEEMRELARLNMQQHRATFGGLSVPDAPFDKNWHELAMKRMLRYAAENGYDVIAWTKGEQQTERYQIGGIVDFINVNPSGDEKVVLIRLSNGGVIEDFVNSDGEITQGQHYGQKLSDVVGKEIAEKILTTDETYYDGGDLKVGGEGMKGFYDKMLPAFMNKYGKKWGVKVADITLPNVERAGRVMHSVPVTDSMKESVMEGQPMFMKRPNGTVYGWTDGKKIYLTEAGINPNTPVHEYTHLWAKAMMQKNPKGWQSVKDLLRGTPVWNEVLNDPNYSSIHADEDLVASEVLSRISGTQNAAKLEQMAQQMIDEAKGTVRKLEARGLIQNIKDALNKFWNWVGTELFGIENFESVEQITDRVLWDLMNKTDLGELSEGQVETQIVTDPKVIAELEASPKRTGYRNVVQNEDGSFSSPMAYWLQSTKGGAKTRVETAKFELGKWEEAEEHPDLVDENGKVTLVKPNKKTVDNVAYDPYIHNRLEPVNLQFKDAWKREDLVYVETEVAENDLNDGYHADKALLPVGVHSWSNGAVMLSRYDKPVRIMPWDAVADAWVERLNGEGVHFDVVPPALRPLLVERGVEILPPHKGMGKDCNDAYSKWKNSISKENSVSLPNVSQAIESGVWNEDALNELDKITEDVEEGKAILKRYTSSELTGLLEGGSLLVRASIISRGSEGDVSSSRRRAESLEERARETIPALTSWAKEVGAWREYSERTEEEIAHSYITSGGEAQVFYLGDGKVEKIIGLDYFVDPQLAIDRIAIHNSLFEETLLKVTGFGTNKDGNFAIIVEQPTIIGNHTDNAEIDSYIESIGFKKVDDTTRTFANEELYLSDLHEENVLNQDHERYYVIDGDFRLNTPEAGIGGTRQIDDSIVRNGSDGILSRRDDIQNAAVDFLVGEPRLRAIENAVNEEASKLGVNVTYKTREQMPEGHKNDKGYYDTKTGEIVVCTENATSIADAIQTILHEAVAHKGLRQLMGDKFDEFINRVYESLDAETKAKVDALAEKHYNGNKAVAMEEYMATLAETTDFADNSVWGKIKSIFEDIINAILGRNDIKIGDNELRYILRASYNNMVNPRNMETVRGWAQDQMMREEYKINEATPEILSRTGIDPDEAARETAKAVYDRIVNEQWQEFQRQFQDAMQPVRIAIDAIQQETGSLPIEDYENFLLMFNQASSRSRVEIDEFSRRHYSPIIESINEIVNSIIEARGGDTSNKKQRAYAYQEIMTYLIAKHGLERNKYYQETKTRKLTDAEKDKAVSKAQKAYDEEIDAINAMELTDEERADMLAKAQEQFNAELEDIETREVPDMRDYSGLTSLFGFPPKKFKEAEDEAQRLVDDFEKMLGRVDDESGETVTPSEQIDNLWKRINAATSKTLRHSYESGMLSRQQYNDIKNMFKFYIPLRGFDETTAEDVYSYARFEGNRFNPAVHKAKGRTSVADDPIATIMSMAESEIAQGNKNRAKQALYNFLLNRAAGKASQNSLMQVESVWYLVKEDESGKEYYEIAVPNRDAGETYEEFEERMRVLEVEEKAVKSKKGKVDIGMRFQKPANMSAHYVFLKVNGVEKAIYINGDPKAAQAINGEHKKKRNELTEKMGALNRFISSMFTNYSLEFTARNYFRDMFYSHINIDVRESDPAYRKKFRQNWRHNNLRSMAMMLKAYRAGEYETRDLNEDEMAFVEFMRNGGQTGYTLINSVEAHKKDLERAIANMQKGIEKGGVKDSTIFKFTLGSIELLNEASELVTRFAAFKTSRDMGRGINTSIADAKEITVNFNTKGAQDGEGFMGMIAQYFGWSKYFFNASVQGVQNLKSMAEANKLKFGSVIGGMVAAGFLMPVITSAIASLFGNDDEEYWNIPEYERQSNFCVPIGKGKYVKVPLPIGFREVYAIGDMVAGAAFNKKFTRDLSQVGTDIANKLASIILPINPLESTANGLGFWHMFAYTTLPSFAQVAVQNMTNTDWKGAPLQKEYTYNEDDPQWMKAFASNPDWMKGLSKWCNEHINLDGDYEGMDWSPEKLDNTLSNVFGGIYSLIKKSGKSISMIWNEENRNLSNVPLSGVVLGSKIDSDDRFVTDAYYDMKEYYDSNVNYINRMAKRFGYSLEDVFEKEKGKHHPKMNEIYSNKNFDFMQEWYIGVKELDAINDKIKKLDKKIAAKKNPTEQDMLKWSRLNDKYITERRDFVNDMLELD